VAIILGVMLFSGGLGRRETSVVGPVFAMLGVVVILLLAGPRSSRAWFTPRR
jgi:hypothetical protein